MKNPWHRRAICWRRVDTLDRASECPACIPPAGPATGKPLAPPGPLGMRVPRLHSYYGSLRLPILVLLGSCWSPSCTTSVLACSLLAGAETLPPQARRIRVRLLRCRLLWWKVSGLPGSWTAPMSTCPALRPRRDGACPAYTACPYCLPQRQQRRLPLARFYRGSITRPIDSLSTLHPIRYRTRRKTRFRLVANLYRVGFSPTGLHYVISAKISFAFQTSRLSWRTDA